MPHITNAIKNNGVKIYAVTDPPSPVSTRLECSGFVNLLGSKMQKVLFILEYPLRHRHCFVSSSQYSESEQIVSKFNSHFLIPKTNITVDILLILLQTYLEYETLHKK